MLNVGFHTVESSQVVISEAREVRRVAAEKASEYLCVANSSTINAVEPDSGLRAATNSTYDFLLGLLAYLWSIKALAIMGSSCSTTTSGVIVRPALLGSGGLPWTGQSFIQPSATWTDLSPAGRERFPVLVIGALIGIFGSAFVAVAIEWIRGPRPKGDH